MNFLKQNCLFWVIIFLFYGNMEAQNTRLTDHNSVGWYSFFTTVKVAPKVSFHGDFQYRRDDYVVKDLQNLLRVGINYQLHPRITTRVGYAHAETFAYGDIPLNSLGRQFSENRTFEAITITDKINKVDLSHRFMLEQRWVGRYSTAAAKTEDLFPLTNRLRYMLRAQLPLKGTSIANKTPYVVAFQEILIQFGKNVGENIFDQNRLCLLLGYRFNNNYRLEAGVINQNVLFGREVDNRNVMQYNIGPTVNLVTNFDFSKKAKV
jgi:hypothetical protein